MGGGRGVELDSSRPCASGTRAETGMGPAPFQSPASGHQHPGQGQEALSWEGGLMTDSIHLPGPQQGRSIFAFPRGGPGLHQPAPPAPITGLEVAKGCRGGSVPLSISRSPQFPSPAPRQRQSCPEQCVVWKFGSGHAPSPWFPSPSPSDTTQWGRAPQGHTLRVPPRRSRRRDTPALAAPDLPSTRSEGRRREAGA